MNLRDYPRPINDTGIGFNFCSDICEYQDEAIRFWIDELSQLGASWLVLPSTLDRPVPVTFLRELITHGIEPVIRVVVRPIRTVDPSAFGELCREYASAGVHYMHLYQEPNLATEWAIVEWNQPNLPKRFAELLLPALGLIANAGLFPLLSPLAPGGHYWDLSFLEQLLNDVAAERPRPLSIGWGFVFTTTRATCHSNGARADQRVGRGSVPTPRRLTPKIIAAFASSSGTMPWFAASLAIRSR
jgi:hypothetical protein